MQIKAMGGGDPLLLWVFKIWWVTVPSDSAFDSRAHMIYEDVSVDSISNPQTLKVRLKTSTTDPF